MVRILVPFLLLSATLQCRQPSSANGTQPPVDAEPLVETFPGNPIALTADAMETIDSAKHLGDVFTVFKFVNLEYAPGAEIAAIDSVVFIEGTWIILDSDGEKILRFSEEGRFLGTVGGIGQGPGEFLKPSEINRGPGNLLGVWDGAGGKFMLYDAEGVFLREQQPITEFGMYPGGQFIWDEEKLYIANTHTRNQDASGPRHTIVDMRHKPYVLGGFGKRVPILEAYRKKGIPTLGFTSFAKFGGRIWTAPPHCADLEIYDTKGQFLGRLSRRHPDKLTYEEIQDLGLEVGMPPRKFLALLSKARNDRMFQVGDLVAASFTYNSQTYFDIFDINGNLLKSNLFPVAPYGLIRGSVDDVLVGSLTVLDNPAFHPSKIFTEEHYQMLLASGWDPDVAERNPGLVLGRLSR